MEKQMKTLKKHLKKMSLSKRNLIKYLSKKNMPPVNNKTKKYRF